ncbi:hypothetical protein DMA15_12460 [Streptomyces sp. WAC 01529]|uniref:hypothetical protein n=1 Tax=Streptomyces sp. WAC 01529 TaxID=2203205 RepID=UPI000F709781|nr:hypothetical protein [Streptomyces sp. WAC 01529]AZM53300.1 hypothetical protein DMA15_12460 [Streptomyces sp. WAC 01529]
MSAQPIERPPLTDFDRKADNELAVAAMLDYLPLPAATMTPRPDAVHITVTSARELSQWMYALGGRHVRTAGADGVVLWTLHTQTPERRGGSAVPIRVHAAVVDGEDVLDEVRPGVTR